MAIIFQKKQGHAEYKVTQAGKSIRLYKNGIFHSQWNPSRPLANHLWDLLFLPVVLRSTPLLIKNTAVLGVGGGAVINLFHRFMPQVICDGVDFDNMHLKLARRFFIEPRTKFNFYHAEASEYIEKSKKQYDLIIEDLFIENAKKKRDPVRAIYADHNWFGKLANRLTRDGLLVMNFEDLTSFRYVKNKVKLNEIGFNDCFVFQMPNYENAIIVLCKQRSHIKTLRQFKTAFSHVFSYELENHSFTMKPIKLRM